MKPLAKTRSVLIAYHKAKMLGVVKYLQEDLEFKEGTWVSNAKKLVNNNCLKSLEEEINLILYEFNLENIYEKDNEKKEKRENNQGRENR